jgi:uncharacterized membrane protein YccF (DUF307 family)
MKRFIPNFVLSLSFLLVSLNAHAIVVDQPAAVAEMETMAKSFENYTTADFLALTPKRFREKTGKRLGMMGSIALKVSQKHLKKAAAENPDAPAGGSKSQITALLLCFFLGGIGIHRFYLGYTLIGVLQIITLGGLGIWTLIDFIRILLGKLKPADGSNYNPTL